MTSTSFANIPTSFFSSDDFIAYCLSHSSFTRYTDPKLPSPIFCITVQWSLTMVSTLKEISFSDMLSPTLSNTTTTMKLSTELEN
ncbi:hypothetical protein T02_697 [Trichinella nativa]|uniref:Uncharacterized protein n=1 Tax=Trichinella nativa TaxID=6335 RepID=A0A0V1LFF2_9BILA|nr:hypothetical protein T02_697 [Trichinella nativa]